MIIICEPQCKGFSHEKFNSGFVYGLRLAFPNEKIVFFSHATHILAIQRMLIHDKVSIDEVEYYPIKYGNAFSILGIPVYYLVLNKIFSFVLRNGSEKVFFLSYSPVILYVIKLLKGLSRYSKLKFTLVLHGGFENISEGDAVASGIDQNVVKIKHDSFYRRIKQVRFSRLIKKIFSRISDNALYPLYYLSSIFFREKKMLLWNHSADFRYIALSTHVKKNANRYIDVNALNMHTVILPTKFEDVIPQPENKYVKFAVFGYGDSLMLYNIALLLSKRKINSDYEIRIIGMDNRGISQFPNISCPSKGKGLGRSEMKEYAKDIDIFLLLYGKNRYRLSCSGSILESLSYCKPIIHFENDCINTFNIEESPIGICCKDLNDFADKMHHIIENYKECIPQFQNHRMNILKLRDKVAIERSVETLRNSFVW